MAAAARRLCTQQVSQRERQVFGKAGLLFGLGGPINSRAMSAEEVDNYLTSVAEPKRGSLQELRRTILEVVPDAEQVISYRVPAFRVQGKVVAGFAAFKDHLSYLPFSGSVLTQLADQLTGYTMTKSALHFPVDRPLPKSLVEDLIAVRLEEIGGDSL